MEVSIPYILMLAAKVYGFIIASGLLLMITCWPINDQATTKIQWAIFAVLEVLCLDAFFFDYINYTF